MPRLSPLQRFEAIKPFTEKEAWNIFRLVALAEAFGWTLLITGILWEKTSLPGHQIAVPIAGNIHGSIFLIYFAVLLATYSSLGWPRWKFVIAAAGVPPYGTLVFEQVTAFYRRRRLGSSKFIIEARALIVQGNTTFVLQPSNGVDWQLPGGEVFSGQTPVEALTLHIQKLFGVRPKLGNIQFVEQTTGRKQTMTYYFAVLNTKDFTTTATASVKGANQVDQAGWHALGTLAEFNPRYLMTVQVRSLTDQQRETIFFSS